MKKVILIFVISALCFCLYGQDTLKKKKQDSTRTAPKHQKPGLDPDSIGWYDSISKLKHRPRLKRYDVQRDTLMINDNRNPAPSDKTQGKDSSKNETLREEKKYWYGDSLNNKRDQKK